MAPGPGQYDIPTTLVAQAPKIPSPKKLYPAEGSFEAAIACKMDLPPPGSYDPKLLPTGERLLGTKGATVTGRYSFSDVDHIVVEEGVFADERIFFIVLSQCLC